MPISQLPTPPRDYRRYHKMRDEKQPQAVCLAYAIHIGLITPTEADQLVQWIYWDTQGIAGYPGTTGF